MLILRLLQSSALLIALILSAATPASAQPVTVKFPKGASGTTIHGTITGRQGIDYRIGVAAGQTMSVQLDSSNPSNYFNITAPGASEALYNSSISGNGTSFAVPSSGNYLISVYLMRNAARRNEKANFTLTLYVEDKAAAQTQRPAAAPTPNPAPSKLSANQMPRFCAGEAAAKYSVRPQDITTNMAFRSGDNYVVQGYFDGQGGSTFFNCFFDLDGSFRTLN